VVGCGDGACRENTGTKRRRQDLSQRGGGKLAEEAGRSLGVRGVSPRGSAPPATLQLGTDLSPSISRLLLVAKAGKPSPFGVSP